MWRQLVLLVALVGVALAAVSISSLEPKPAKYANVDGCYFGDLDTVIPVNSSIAAPKDKGCLQYNCREYDSTTFSCGVVKADPPCYTTTDLTKDYPYCCEQIVCPKSECN